MKKQGTVKFFQSDRGFGFITVQDGTDFFFHISNVTGDIAKNDKVEFEVRPDKKGKMQAMSVKVLGG